MKLAFACLKTDPNKLSDTLNILTNAFPVAQKHQVKLLLCGEEFLGQTPLILDSQALFRLKLACIHYDIALGVGFKLEDKNNYVIIDTKGEIILNYQENQKEFSLFDKTFTITLGDDGFTADKTTNVLIWPIHSAADPKTWFNTELSRYRQQANDLANESLLVNTYHDGLSFGGAFHLKDNVLLTNQPMEQSGLSIIEL